MKKLAALGTTEAERIEQRRKADIMLATAINFVQEFAVITLAYSNGPTEGHSNRLKMLKRQMFGCAKLDLLKKRVMAAH